MRKPMNQFDAKEAAAKTNERIDTYQDSIDKGLFEKIEEAIRNRKFQTEIGRSPTSAEMGELKRLGYHYKCIVPAVPLCVIDFDEHHIISWHPDYEKMEREERLVWFWIVVLVIILIGGLIGITA